MQQPFQLKAYIKETNSILDITGYDLLPNNTIKIFGVYYIQKFRIHEVKILRCTGIVDNTGQYLFEGDVVELLLRDRTFKGAVSFNNGAFVCEGEKEVILEWPNSMQIGKCGNIFTDPLALQTVTV